MNENIDSNLNKKNQTPCPCRCKEICLCKCGEECYNNKDCCYLRPKDISLVQVNDPTLFQVMTELNNLYLTAVPIEINTAGCEIESSALQIPNDTLVINDSGIYNIYLSLKYSFKYNSFAKEGDISKVKFSIVGNGEEIFNIEDTIFVPKIMDEQSEEIVKTIQGRRLKSIKKDLPYKINIVLDEFDFDKSVLNQIMIVDLTLIVEKMI